MKKLIAMATAFGIFSGVLGTLPNQPPIRTKALTTVTTNQPIGEIESYAGHYYQIFSPQNGSTWYSKEEYCEELGGHLVTINSAFEQEYIEQLLEKFQKSGSNCKHLDLGGYYSTNDKEWHWIDGSQFDYTFWNTEQPDNYTGNEYFLEIYAYTTEYETWSEVFGRWNDYSGADNNYFICEWDSDPENIPTLNQYKKPKYTDIFYFPSDNEHDYQSNYYFDDSYFEKDAFEYNQSLATMTLCFVLSAFGSNETNDYTQKSKNAVSLLKDLDFDYIETNKDFQQKPEKDTMGVIAGFKEITVNDEKYTLIAVSTRGGGYEAEWASNLTVGSTGRHEGFDDAATITKEFISKYIDEHKGKFQDKVKLWIGGYSRGAITANIAAADITLAGGIGGIKIENKDIYAYCFETPQGVVLSSEKNKDYDSLTNIHNIINPADIVTKVAMTGWDFTRFGTNENVIPSEITDSGYKTNFGNMMFFFKRLNESPFTKEPNPHVESSIVNKNGNEVHIMQTFQGKEFELPKAYKAKSIGDLGYYFHMPSIFSPSLPVRWSPLKVNKDIYTKNCNYPMDDFLNDLAESISVGLINRQNYTINFQPLVRELLAAILGEGYSYKAISKAFDILLKKVKDNKGILFFGSCNIITRQFMAAVVSRMIIDSFHEAGIDILAAKHFSDRKSAIKLIDSLALAIADSILISGSKLICTLIENFNIIEKGHYPELCLSWMQSQDANYLTNYLGYNGGELSNIKKETYNLYRKVIINCPVDVNVYDSNDKIVASIINNEPQELDDTTIFASFNSDGEKIVYLPGNESYRVEILSTDSGELNYSVCEYSYDTNSYIRIENYYDIPINKGSCFEGVIPKYTKEDNTEKTEITNCDYLLKSNNKTIVPDVVLTGDKVKEAKYLINTMTNDEKLGLVNGGGVYLEGEYTSITAIPYNENEFTGWYIDGKLISTDIEYRFRITEDKTIEAKFVGDPIGDCDYAYEVNTQSENGVVILDKYLPYYKENEIVEIEAIPDEGYVFKEWIIDNKNIKLNENEENKASFIMPTTDVNIIAVFIDENHIIKYLLGDVTGDKIIDATDASFILTAYAKSSIGEDDDMNDEQRKAADVNCDGVIDAVDASTVLTYYAQSSTGFEGTLDEFMNTSYKTNNSQ